MFFFLSSLRYAFLKTGLFNYKIVIIQQKKYMFIFNLKANISRLTTKINDFKK